jgi:phenylpropionate dioxygenase-like ring-hydroxylating dioxygenase large terminal subunit
MAAATASAWTQLPPQHSPWALLLRTTSNRCVGGCYSADHICSSAALFPSISTALESHRVALGAVADSEDLWQRAQFPQTWVPLASVWELDGNRPNPVYFLGSEFIVYQGHFPPEKSANNQGWVVTGPTCPHRLAPLSEGRIVPTTRDLECSYHGWTFDGATGICTHIPQYDSTFATIPKCTLPTFPSLVVKNIIWTWPWPTDPWDSTTTTASATTGNTVPLPHRLPEWMLSDVQMSSPVTYTRDLPYGYDTLLENIIDVSHLPFAHHGLLGTRGDAMPIPMSRPENVTVSGFDFTITDRAMKKIRNGTSIFRAPFVLSYSSELWPDSYKTTTVQRRNRRSKQATPPRKEFNLTTVVIPTKPGWSRAIVLRSDPASEKKASSKSQRQTVSLLVKVLSLFPVWLIHQYNNVVLDSDLVFLHGQEQELERRRVVSEVTSTNSTGGHSPLWSRAYFMPAQADRAVVALRCWIDTYVSLQLLRPLPPTQVDRRQLFDRWTQHSEHCRHCNKAAIKALPQWRRRTYLVLAASVLLMTKFLLARVAIVMCLGLLRFYNWADDSLRQGEFHHYKNH